MFGSNVGFSELADLMVQLSMTLSDPEPQFQGHSLVQRRISRKWCMMRPNISSALCIYDGIFCLHWDKIPTYSNDMNVFRSLSNSWAHCCYRVVQKAYDHVWWCRLTMTVSVSAKEIREHYFDTAVMTILLMAYFFRTMRRPTVCIRVTGAFKERSQVK